MSVSAASLWLKTAAAIFMISFGMMFAAAAWPPPSAPVAFLIDLVFWPMDGLQPATTPEARLLLAIGGGITAGWGLTIWLIASRILPDHPALARSVLLPSILFWFAIDSTCSVLAGAPLNAVANAGFLAAFLWPLVRLRA